MNLDDLNEAPMGILNKLGQKVLSKVPGNIGAKAQGKLDAGRLANKWKQEYMKFLIHPKLKMLVVVLLSILIFG